MVKKKKDEEMVGNYLVKDKPPLGFISSGCEILNCILSGGYPLGRIVNIVGDRSTGKTLLAIEAFANFSRQYPDGKMFYHETESAFDYDYAETLGMPVDRINFVENVETVEDLYDNLQSIIEENNKEPIPVIYVVDSLDALSAKAEKEEADKEGISKGTYGLGVPKQMSKLFKLLIKDISNSSICLIIISQIRDKINVMFGERYTRAGGKALDFYASQTLWLSELGKLKKTIRGIERPYGIKIRAKCKKNKIGLPYRECEFPIIFGYGIDDLTANLSFLSDVKGALEEIGLKASTEKEIRELTLQFLSDKEMKCKISDQVKKIWFETEKEFLPTVSKYE